MSATVDQIKSRLSIVDVVSSYIKLQKAGINYKAVCPFHSEKTPSFSVSPERGTFHCFGCGKGGDIFTFVEEMEGLDFMGALKVLADRAGVEIVFDGKRENRDEKDRLYAVLSDAADFFHAQLVKNKDALLYLKKRGLDAKIAEDFYLGFAPDAWDELFQHLSRGKYSGEEMEKAGLVLKSREGRRGWYDRFRSRIMFPLFDSAGRIIGFSGRLYGKEEGKEAGAKYVNSPETELYHKSKILYGLHRAKSAIREQGFAILVEGQMDLLLSHQIGLANTVAVSGTALTEEHLATLKRFADKVVFGFDGDAAGIAAAKRGVLLALQIGLEPCVAEILEGKDPADLARESPEKWRKSVQAAEHAIVFFLKAIKCRTKDPREIRLEARKEILPLIAAMKSAIDRAHFIEFLSHEIGISEEVIQEEMRSLSRGTLPNDISHRKEEKKHTNKTLQTEDVLRGLILWQESKAVRDIDVDDVRQRYKGIAGDKQYFEMDSLPKEEKERLVIFVQNEYSSVMSSRLAEDMLLSIEREDLEKKQKLLSAELSSEEKIKEYDNISKKLQEVKEKQEELHRIT